MNTFAPVHHMTILFWGGLMSLRAFKVGAAFAVLNGYSRNAIEISRPNYSVFSADRYGQDKKTRGNAIDSR